MYKKLVAFHAFYFLITGLWPLVSIDSFMFVTGWKHDIWLVKTVGLLTASIAVGLTVSLIRNKYELAFLIAIVCACLSFLYIDVFYWCKGVLRGVYLVDAAIQILLCAVHILKLSSFAKL
jgi:hypothetical protein